MEIETEEVGNMIRIKDPKREVKNMHYYGDKIRVLYIVMSFIMLVASPFVKNLLPFPAFLSIFGFLLLTIIAGIINPKTKTIIILNFIVSIILVIVFGKEAIVTYKGDIKNVFFLLNFILSIGSLFALYYSSKTVRGVMLYKDNN